ncbi:hypothetical protein K491DRAFT_707610 [Lophiostoma macrostomum CBS 122681]|uniref:Rhodopsin domain-containing protein n=1 Tax=Lophiostoma macrostomum CBS 122681 TaxID=1314788 RepID=A0A6A6SS37_9PLEO|nr:hypothetical protein K491DRAFT_707610 [Lophiostoma macrostomum CBS 122681]
MYSPGGSGLLAEGYILLILSFGLIVLRGYVRLYITARNGQGWRWDDTTIVIAWIFYLVEIVILHIKVDFGAGRHVYDIPHADIMTPRIRTCNIFYEINCVIVTLITKISISMYILRIRDDKQLRRLLWTLMALMTMATIATIGVLGSTCIPMRKLWEPNIPGKCLDLKTIYNVAYVQSAFTIVIDLGLSLVPVYILWDIKIARPKKIFICTLTSLGLIATVSNAIWNAFTETLASRDFTYNQIAVTVAATLEMGAGIIAACIPTCVGILRINRLKTQHSTGHLHSSRVRLHGSRSIGVSTPTPLATNKTYDTLKDDDATDMVPLSYVSSKD